MNIRTIKKKIKSVTNVKKITKAMQMVSAIKMKKAQMLATEGKPYQEEIEKIIKAVSKKIDPSFSPLIIRQIDKNSKNRKLAIVVATNKGLCGSFNFNLLRFIVKNADFKNTDFIIVGKKASLLGKFGANIISDYSSNIPLNSVSAVFKVALSKFIDKTYDEVILFYNQFISTLSSNPINKIILPVSFTEDENIGGEVKLIEKSYEYLIEPNPKQIINSLLKSYVEEKLRFAFIQSEAGEHSLRMIAMKNATDNATDVIYNLTMVRNKVRQEKITSELLDMITAKESVESN